MIRILISAIFALVSGGYLSAVLMVLLKHDQKTPVKARRTRR